MIREILFGVGSMSLLLLGSCGYRTETKEDSNNTVALAQPEPPEPVASVSSHPVCKDGNTELRSLHNFPSAGYHGNISKCVDEVEIQLALWTGSNISFGFMSDACPDMSFHSLSGKELPDIREASRHIQIDVLNARKFLEQELARFREQCGLPELGTDGSLQELDLVLEEEVSRSWVQNRYGELRDGGPTDENLLKQAHEDYENLK